MCPAALRERKLSRLLDQLRTGGLKSIGSHSKGYSKASRGHSKSQKATRKASEGARKFANLEQSDLDMSHIVAIRRFCWRNLGVWSTFMFWFIFLVYVQASSFFVHIFSSSVRLFMVIDSKTGREVSWISSLGSRVQQNSESIWKPAASDVTWLPSLESVQCDRPVAN